MKPRQILFGLVVLSVIINLIMIEDGPVLSPEQMRSPFVDDPVGDSLIAASKNQKQDIMIKDNKDELPLMAGCPGNPPELGKACWLRQLDDAKTASARDQKPVLILFQEVPGCANCTQYGSSTLSHPLIVEAIETSFIPLCIHNNKEDSDAEALKMFNEPAWNNPVVRIIDAQMNDLTPRMPDFKSQSQIVVGMTKALEKAGQPVPEYLKLLAAELRSRESKLDTATFAMHCFWTGEAALGQLDGVVGTTAGFQDGKEVVQTVYDPNITNLTKIKKQIAGKEISSCSTNKGFAIDKEPKYHLAQSLWRFVPMTSLQASRANSLLGNNQSPEAILSPRQLDFYEAVKATNGKNFTSQIGSWL